MARNQVHARPTSVIGAEAEARLLWASELHPEPENWACWVHYGHIASVMALLSFSISDRTKPLPRIRHKPQEPLQWRADWKQA